MKKTWEVPVIFVQQFEANEYVAACWSVACGVGAPPGNYGGYGEEQNWFYWGGVEPLGADCDNHTGSCSNPANNQFRVENGVVSFYAENSDQLGSLNGGYTGYIDNNGDGVVNGGDTIFWYTVAGADRNSPNGRRWNHYGTVVNADNSHPNRS